ncbi:hypothetical protein KC571_00095 [candidate division WWE3 bacterium]|uniref:Uncharacterized protein n=1 Tax=candidate division WWE3 bacterium TaxID=2053526 RepID=A0A955RPN7_UNCKA|nr:hypothetical protein [candidate division WWE3 bacterium]
MGLGFGDQEEGNTNSNHLYELLEEIKKMRAGVDKIVADVERIKDDVDKISHHMK